MVVSLGKNLKIQDTEDTFVSNLDSNFEYQYNYILNTVQDPYDLEDPIILKDVLESLSTYYNVTATELPLGASIKWYLPNGESSSETISAACGSLVPYKITFSDSSVYINYIRISNHDMILNCSNLEPNLVTLTIIPTPSDATVVLNVDGYNMFGFTQSGNSIKVSSGTTVNYTVSKNLISISDSVVVDENTQPIYVDLGRTYVDVENYIYSGDSSSLIITKYNGSDTDIIAPHLEIEEI